MRPYSCSILIIFALLLLLSLSTAQAAPTAPTAPSLDLFLSSLSTAGTAGTAPVGMPQPQWTTDCYATYQGCLAGCGGNSGCQLLCQCAYYDCRGMDRPSFCL